MTTQRPAQFSRRKWLMSLSTAGVLLSIQKQSWAGGQVEEPLSDAVRTALSASVAEQGPPKPVFVDTQAYLGYQLTVNAPTALSKLLHPKA